MSEFEAPARSVEDVLAGRLRLSLGGEVYVLPVRSIAENRVWVESVEARLGAQTAALADATDLAQAALALGAVTAEQMLELVLSYDVSGILPDYETAEAVVRPHELLAAVPLIGRVRHPLADLAVAIAEAEASRMSGLPSAPMSSSRRNMAGRRKSSRAA